MTGRPPVDPLAQHVEELGTLVQDAGQLRHLIEYEALKTQNRGITEEERAIVGVEDALGWAARRGVTRVGYYVVITYWAALEVFVQDVFAFVCQHVDLADVPDLAKVRVSLAEFVAATEDERYRILWDRVVAPSGHGVDRFDYLFQLIGMAIDVTRTRSVETWPVPDNASTRRSLRELQEVRNVILHRGAMVDRKLARIAPTFTVDQPVTLGDEHIERYGRAVIDYASGSLVSALAALGYMDGEDVLPPPPGTVDE